MKVHTNIYADDRAKDTVKLYIQFSWTEGGQQRKRNMNTPFKVLKEEWNEKHKSVTPTTDEGIKTRDRINKLTDFMTRLPLSIPDAFISDVRAFLNSDPEQPLQNPQRLRDFVSVFIENNKAKYSKNSIRRYQTLLTNIKEFCETRSDIFGYMPRDAQQAWFSVYIDFLIKKDYHNPSIKQEFKLLSSIKNAFDTTGIIVEPSKFVNHLKEGNTQGSNCTEPELKAILSLDTSGKTWSDYAVDLFVFMCLTGLRIGEIKLLRKNDLSYINSVSDVLVLTYTSEKTGNQNSVPLSTRAHEIINRWSGASGAGENIFPKFYMDVMKLLRDRIKVLPAFTRTETKVRYKGAERIETEVPRWQSLTLHSARHTYSYLMSAGGMSMDEVGKLLNHSSADTTRRHYEHVDKQARLLKALEILEVI